MHSRFKQSGRTEYAHHLIKNVRELVGNKLPISNSLLPLDILLVVLDKNHKEHLTVKQLFASVPYSHTGLRYHFGRLLKDGWLELDVIQADRRNRVVMPTQKLLVQFDDLVDQIYASTNLIEK
jgi:hypothetical protein